MGSWEALESSFIFSSASILVSIFSFVIIITIKYYHLLSDINSSSPTPTPPPKKKAVEHSKDGFESWHSLLY